MPLFVRFCGNINHVDFSTALPLSPLLPQDAPHLAGAVSEVYEKIFLSDDDAIGGADDRPLPAPAA